MDYEGSEPIPEAISKVNEYFDSGHMVIFWTARGTGSGKDWRALTESQLHKWGVRYHELKMGKPVYDLFIDDKNINAQEWLDRSSIL
jgi:dTDP-glucose 4,6-dehydratase